MPFLIPEGLTTYTSTFIYLTDSAHTDCNIESLCIEFQKGITSLKCSFKIERGNS